jgi:hypothetical protein
VLKRHTNFKPMTNPFSIDQGGSLSTVVERIMRIDSERPFEDRVVLWLLPNMEQETIAFHTPRRTRLPVSHEPAPMTPLLCTLEQRKAKGCGNIG